MVLNRRNRARLSLALALVIVPSVTRAADVLQHVPPDSLAIVVIKNVIVADSKVTQLFKSLQLNFPGPLGFLKATTGVSDGIDPSGDFLFAVLPGDAPELPPSLAVWLPVNEYDRLVRAMGAAPGQQISTVTIGGEDVLVAHQDSWALVMDPDARQRMEQMLAANPAAPPQLAAWKSWIDSNDATAVALAPGLRTILTQSGPGGGYPNTESESNADDIFGANQADQEVAFTVLQADAASSDDLLARVRTEIRKWIGSSRKLYNLASRSSAVGCGLQLESDGSARMGLRLAFDENANLALSAAQRETENAGPPTLGDSHDFVVTGDGRLPATIFTAIASAHIQQQISGLESTERMRFDREAVARVVQAIEVAAADVLSAAVLVKPGDDQESVYTNHFAAVHVVSASAFVDHAKEIVRLWNKMNIEVQGDTHFIFDVEETKVGKHAATHYSLDMAAVEGGAVIPEVRQAMEKFFGPGGKLRFFIAPVDETTVLLAMATPEQTAAALKSLDQKHEPLEDNEYIRAVNQLLPPDRDWRFFFNPHDYTRWLRRLREAMVGVPVIGGPLVREFPPAPPIGVAGGFRDHEAWADVAVPVQTIQSAGTYLQMLNKKGVQLQR